MSVARVTDIQLDCKHPMFPANLFKKKMIRQGIVGVGNMPSYMTSGGRDRI